jgi:hypothetical protein
VSRSQLSTAFLANHLSLLFACVWGVFAASFGRIAKGNPRLDVVLTFVWTPFSDKVKYWPKPKVSAEAPPGIVDFVRARFGFQPDARQIEVLESDAKQGILNCSRQWGKSTVSAAKAIYRAWSRPGCLVLVASPGERQSAEWMRKARGMVRQMGLRVRGDGDNKISLLLPTGSRIVGLPGMDGTVRGFSAVSMLLIDEASRVPDSMYRALRPMLAVSDGDLWLMSTPRGKQGFFYEAWEHGGADWFRVHGPAPECSRIRAEFLERERGVMGALAFRQEYLGEFVDCGAGVFGRDAVEAALDDEVPALEFD